MKYNITKNITFVGKYDMPVIAPTQLTPKQIIPFNLAMSLPPLQRKNYFVHFFIDDYQFERVYTAPQKYIEIFKCFAGLIGTDFSLYADMPKSQQVYNSYRNKLLCAYYQEFGIPVIPAVSWSSVQSYDFCFDGLPTGSVLAVSSVGCMSDKLAQLHFVDGFREMCKRLTPTRVVLVGELPDELTGYSDKILSFDTFAKKFIKEK